MTVCTLSFCCKLVPSSIFSFLLLLVCIHVDSQSYICHVSQGYLQVISIVDNKRNHVRRFYMPHLIYPMNDLPELRLLPRHAQFPMKQGRSGPVVSQISFSIQSEFAKHLVLQVPIPSPSPFQLTQIVPGSQTGSLSTQLSTKK